MKIPGNPPQKFPPRPVVASGTRPPPPASPSRRPWRLLAATVLCVVLVILAINYIDRPASTWSHRHFHRPEIFSRLTQYPDPIPLAATIGLAGAGFAAVFCAWHPSKAGHTFIAGCIAVLVGESIKEQLKYFFGRTWPETWTSNNPSWITTHASGFNFLHGGSGWESFPSGHMTQMTAIAAVIWIRLPRLRWLAVVLPLALAFTLWISNYHYVGDIIAGTFLGALCGMGTVGAVCRPWPGPFKAKP